MLRRTQLKPISPKKIQQLKKELPIRQALCERAGGEWILSKLSLIGGRCKGGICECGCGRAPGYESGYELHPHEDPHRGVGGKVSLETSKMVRNDCHAKLQHPARHTKVPLADKHTPIILNPDNMTIEIIDPDGWQEV